MSVLDEITDVIENIIIPNAINALRQFTIAVEEEENAFYSSIEKDIEKYKEEGVLTTFVEDVSPTTNHNKRSPLKSLQEDLIPIPDTQHYKRQNRSQKDALTDIANVVNDHNKQRNKRIKNERATNDHEAANQEIDMPAPTKPPLRSKRRAKNQSVEPNSEIKLEILDNSVIEIPRAPLDVIVLDDSLESSKPVRVTRARTKRHQAIKEERESLAENFTKKVKMERTSKRKQLSSNETGVIELSPQKKKMRGDDTDIDTTVMEVQNATHVKETVSSPMKKKVKGKAAYVKQSNRSTAEHFGGDSSEGEAAALPRPTRVKKQSVKDKKQISKDKTNSSEGETLASPQEIIAEDDTGPVGNETVCLANPTILEEKQALANETMVITKPSTVDDLMTDDEDFVPSSPPVHQGQGTQIFSPYESSPVKKRVQAFEKLESMNAEVTNVTRSKIKPPGTPKTRAQVEAFEKLGTMNADPAATVTRSKAKLDLKVAQVSTSTPNTKIPKLFGTPVNYKNFQTSSASKASSNTMNGKLLTSTAGKTGSALKASQMEFRERELRRQQKEQEAIQKKEALLQSSIEEKRRKREEREMKVHQLKASKEKEKKRQLLSAEKTKEEKLRQVLAEKEAKFIKQKEEAAQKRAAALKKVEDDRKNQVPRDDGVIPYLEYPTPPLPTPDCYDSDDSSARATMVIPQFQQKQTLKKMLLQMSNLYAYRKELFISGHDSPNLREIFPGIQASKLKRTSSGIWNKTERSMLESMIEEYEDE